MLKSSFKTYHQSMIRFLKWLVQLSLLPSFLPPVLPSFITLKSLVCYTIFIRLLSVLPGPLCKCVQCDEHCGKGACALRSQCDNGFDIKMQSDVFLYMLYCVYMVVNWTTNDVLLNYSYISLL